MLFDQSRGKRSGQRLVQAFLEFGHAYLTDLTRVDFPVPRGPKRKKLCFGVLKKRSIDSILSLKLELHYPKYSPVCFLSSTVFLLKSTGGAWVPMAPDRIPNLISLVTLRFQRRWTYAVAFILARLGIVRLSSRRSLRL